MVSNKYSSRPNFVTSNAYEGIVYWTDADNGFIFKAAIGVSEEPEVFLDNQKAEGIAFEWFYSNIYYINSERRDIVVCHQHDPATCVVVYHEIENIPHGIAVDPNYM